MGGDEVTVAPGQFMMVYAFGIGEVPISVSGPPNRPGPVVLTVRAVGACREAICAARARRACSASAGRSATRGRSTSAQGGDVVVVAGGIGLAPLRPVVLRALERRADYGNVRRPLRRAHAGDLLYPDGSSSGASTLDVPTTVDAAGRRLDGPRRRRPEARRRRALRPGAHHGVRLRPGDHDATSRSRRSSSTGVRPERIQISMERHMQCGVGLCGHCQLGPTLICRDGPVYCVRRGRSMARDEGAVTRACEAEARRLEVRLVRRLPALAARPRGRAARDRRRRRHGRVPRGDERRRRGTVRPLARRGLDHDRARRRADPGRARAMSKALVTIGACATVRRHPGAAQLRRRRASSSRAVYASPEYISTLETSTPIAAHVHVDFELHGCPIDKRQLLEVVTAFLHGRKPGIPSTSVCTECKRRGIVCVTVAHGTPCLGPVTHAGCGALCPGYNRGCYGCFGPMETPNTARARAATPAARARPSAASSASSTRSTRTRRRSRRRPAVPERRDDPDRLPRARRGRGRDDRAPRERRGRAASSCGSSSRRASSRRSSAAARSWRRPTSRRASAASARSRTRRAPSTRSRTSAASRCPSRSAMLRRLLYCGEWIESHALHVYMLHAPDFLGYDGAVELARDAPEAVERGLALKKTGNELMTVIGGREIHPINVRVGGFYRAPTKRELRALVEPLERAREAALETVRWTAGFDFPERVVECELVALSPSRRLRDRARPDPSRTAGSTSRVGEYDEHFEEEHVERSNALQSQLRERGTYLCGPLARYALNHARAARRSRARLPREVGLEAPCRDPFRSIVVRSVELVYACDEALRLIDAYEEPDAPAVPVEPRAGTGLRRQRGAARPALPPLPRRRRRHDPRREDRPADLAEPAGDRGRPPRRRRPLRRSRRRRAARASASRRSATTTRASRARRTS